MFPVISSPTGITLPAVASEEEEEEELKAKVCWITPENKSQTGPLVGEIGET